MMFYPTVSQLEKVCESYLASEQIADHLCVSCGCSQVKGCHLVHVCVWEPEHPRLPQIVHCNTGKDRWRLVRAWFICVWLWT